jgi:spermidine synthase
LLLLFFGSGCAALIYEVVWLQLLELVIGSSGISLGVLLGTYMGGMCLGSLLLPRVISQKFHPLRVYALLELGIGMIGILVLAGIPLVTDFYASMHWHGIVMRALVAGACLIPPTLLMGATLPAVARFVESTQRGVSWMGFFYGGNIAGAVVGCLLAGFFLLRLFDMPTGTYVAAGINTLVAIIGFILAAKSRYIPRIMRSIPNPAIFANRTLVYTAIALSGLSALGAEVVWTRLLALLMGGTVYSFSIILAVFLVGLGLGSGAGSLICRTSKRPRLALGLCQLLLAGFICWAALMISKSLPYWPINPGIYTGDWGPWYIFQLDILRAAWVILPAALLWGASFPLAIASIASEAQDPGRMVGGIYAANTIGSILGSLAFSLWIIPKFGTLWAERSLAAIAAVSAVIALLSFVTGKGTDERRSILQRISFSGTVCTGIVLLCVAWLAVGIARIPWMAVAWGRFCASYIAQAEPKIDVANRTHATGSSPTLWHCLYMGEGMNVSVAVTKSSSGAIFFHGAGKVQASSQPQDMRLQRMLGHLSVLACKNPSEVKDVLVVACGAGVTAGSFLVYPKIQNVTVCDIEPLVPKVVTPMFSRENYHLMDGIDKQNPHIVNGKQVSAIYDDGRHYIRTLPPNTKFDVITSDPIDPWIKGSAALNTVEFYQMCKGHLKPGGVMTLWMPLYESNSDSAKSMIASFFQAFPDGMLFSNDEHAEGYDAVLLGQLHPSAINLDEVDGLLSRGEYSAVRESLYEVGFGSGFNHPEIPDLGIVLDLFSTFAVRSSDLQPWMRNAQINHDRNLRLQYLAGMYFNSYLSTTIFQNIVSHYRFPNSVFAGSPEKIERLKRALSTAGRR